MQFPVVIPFVEHLGLFLTSVDQDHCELGLDPRPEHLNSHAVTHGGVLMTLLDVAMATAARAGKVEVGVVTIEMKTSFMQPARGLLTVKATVMQRTTNMAFTQATVYDSHQRACAHATGTFKFVHQGGRGVRTTATAVITD
jgi:uncharacterized protein (TIGR00369 family)